MMSINRKGILIGVSTTILSFILLLIISILWFGKERFFHEEDLFSTFKLFSPIWSIMFGFCGWWITKRYFQKKSIILGENHEKMENIGEWKRYLSFTLGRYLKMISLVIAITIPVFFIDYLGNSKVLGSSVGYMVFFVVIGILSFIFGKIFETKSLKHQKE